MHRLIVAVFFSMFASAALTKEYNAPQSPADIYGALFQRVQLQKIFSDGKTFSPPIKFEVDNSGPKSILKWISLENEKDIVSYSKEL